MVPVLTWQALMHCLLRPQTSWLVSLVVEVVQQVTVLQLLISRRADFLIRHFEVL